MVSTNRTDITFERQDDTNPEQTERVSATGEGHGVLVSSIGCRAEGYTRFQKEATAAWVQTGTGSAPSTPVDERLPLLVVIKHARVALRTGTVVYQRNPESGATQQYDGMF